MVRDVRIQLRFCGSLFANLGFNAGLQLYSYGLLLALEDARVRRA